MTDDGRRAWRTAARFALVFAVVYLLLRASWPWVERGYSYVVQLEITAAAGVLGTPLDVERFEPERRKEIRGVSFDIEVNPVRATARPNRRESTPWPFRLSSRQASYEPTAMLLALVLATPVGVRRRARAFLVAAVVLHVLVTAFSAAEIRYCLLLDESREVGILEYAIVASLSYAGGQAETHTVLPILLWAAAFPDVLLGSRALEWLRNDSSKSASETSPAP